jgi:hypothetical protein
VSFCAPVTTPALQKFPRLRVRITERASVIEPRLLAPRRCPLILARMRPFALALVLAVGAHAAHAHAKPLRPAPARALFVRHVSAGLTPSERSVLLAGQTVTRPMLLENAEGRYVGGVSYQVVPATPLEVLRALGNVKELPGLLPRTRAARFVSAGADGGRVELNQGTSVVNATYTIWIRRRGGNELRFWLDPTRPHGIRDVWGYVRATPFAEGKSLVTVAVALDVGPGLVRMLFEDRIQRVIFDTPRQMRDYFEPRALARRN